MFPTVWFPGAFSYRVYTELDRYRVHRSNAAMTQGPLDLEHLIRFHQNSARQHLRQHLDCHFVHRRQIRQRLLLRPPALITIKSGEADPAGTLAPIHPLSCSAYSNDSRASSPSVRSTGKLDHNDLLSASILMTTPGGVSRTQMLVRPVLLRRVTAGSG